MQPFRSDNISFRGFTIILISVILIVTFVGYNSITQPIDGFGEIVYRIFFHTFYWLIPIILILMTGFYIGSNRKPRYL